MRSSRRPHSNGKKVQTVAPTSLSELALRVQICAMRVDEKLSVPFIADQMGMTHEQVYSILNSRSKVRQLAIEHQLNDILTNSVNLLAALTNRMLRAATGELDLTPSEREVDSLVYRSAFDRTMPLLDVYFKQRPAQLGPELEVPADSDGEVTPPPSLPS